MTNSHRNVNNLKEIGKKREAPFSLRLTFEERAALEAAAGDMPLGAYIKAVLFGQDLQNVNRLTIGTPDRRANGTPLSCG